MTLALFLALAKPPQSGLTHAAVGPGLQEIAIAPVRRGAAYQIALTPSCAAVSDAASSPPGKDSATRLRRRAAHQTLEKARYMATLEDAVRFDRELRPRALPALLGDFGLGHLAHKLQAADLDLPSAKLLQKHDLVELGIHGDSDREAFLELLKTRDVGVVVWYREDRGIGFVRPLGTDFDDGL